MHVPDSNPAATRRRLLGSGLVALAGLAGCAMPTTMTSETTSTSFGQSDATALAVETENGDISLEQGEGDRVDVEATKRTSGDTDTLDRISVVSDHTDGTLTVRVDRSDVSPGVTVSVDLDVAVPSSLPVGRVETTNGEVTVKGVGGDGTYRTENGDVDLSTTNGDVTVEELSLSDRSDGNDSVTGTLGDGTHALSARTTNGDVTLSVLD